MFATLLKYEFRRTKNILLPMNIGGLAIGAVGYFVMLIMTALLKNPDSDIVIALPLVYLLWVGLALMLALLSLALSIVLCLQFYREKFTDQGYLTFTLPASTHQILLSSYLNFFIWTVVNTIVTFIAVLMMVVPFITFMIEQFSQLGMDFSYPMAMMKENLGTILPSGVLYTIAFILSTVSSLFYGISLPYLAITLASVLVKKMKLLVAVGIGYGMYMVMGVISSALTMLEGMATVLLSGVFETPILTGGSVTLIIMSVIYMAFTIGGYFLMHHLVTKKLNL